MATSKPKKKPATEPPSQKIIGMSPDKLCMDDRAQPREAIDRGMVEEYAEARRAGTIFPPVVAFAQYPDDPPGEENPYWLADGFHRTLAEIEADLNTTIGVILHKGDLRDAILHSVGSNATHGLRRTNEDKRRAVMTLLDDAEWSQWSDRRIADQCGVDGKTVAAVRDEARCGSSAPEPEKRTGSDGKSYTVKPPARSKPTPPAEKVETVSAALADAPEPVQDVPLAVVQTVPDEPERPAFEGELQAAPKPLTDEEWLTTLTLREKLNDRTRAIFDSDALFYRRVVDTDAYRAFLAVAKKATAKTKDAVMKPSILSKLYYGIRVVHPNAWLLCSACSGTGASRGSTGASRGCDKGRGCGSRGYQVVTK